MWIFIIYFSPMNLSACKNNIKYKQIQAQRHNTISILVSHLQKWPYNCVQSVIIVTRPHLKDGEGNIFTLCVSPHPDGRGGTPSCWFGGGVWVSNPRSGQGGTPAQVWMGDTPFQGQGRVVVPHSQVWMRVPPTQDWWGTSDPDARCCKVWCWTKSLSTFLKFLCVPPCPGLDRVHPPPPPPVRRRSSIASTYYAAGGMPLAFTQEDFLVKQSNNPSSVILCYL